MSLPRMIVPALVLLLAAVTAAAEHREMEWSETEPPSLRPVIANEGEALLIVESTVPDLTFASNRGGILSVTTKSTGTYYVKLEAGVHYLTIESTDPQTVWNALSLPRLSFASKQYMCIKVTPKLLLGAFGSFDESRPEIRIVHSLANPDEPVFAVLDDLPAMEFDFQNGHETIKTETGRHTLQLFEGDDRYWSESFDLESGETVEVRPDFARRAERFEEEVPGSLFITSEPTGARVYLNQVDKGLTDLNLENLQPGEYTIEVVKDLHLPHTEIVTVQSATVKQPHVVLEPNYGRVMIDSEPPGALVRIDGRQVGRTPYEMRRFAAGRYGLELSREYFHDHGDTIVVDPGDTFDETYRLRPQFGSVSVESRPGGARVYVDGEFWDTAPVRRDTVLSGTHQLRLTLDNHRDWEETIAVLDGQPTRKIVSLTSNVGWLSLDTSPGGAEVRLVDGNRRLGATPLRDVALEPGSHRIRVTLADHHTEEFVHLAQNGVRGTKRLDLRRKTGRAYIVSTPPGATVYVDGRRHGQIAPTYVNDLPTGRHELRLELAGHDTYIEDFTIVDDRQTDRRISLDTRGTDMWKARRSRARLMALVLPTSGQFISGQSVRGGIYAAGLLGAGYLAYAASAEHGDESDRFDAAMANYEAAVGAAAAKWFDEAEDARSKMQDADDRNKLFLAVAGGVYAVQLIDALLFGGGAKPTVDRTRYSVLPRADVTTDFDAPAVTVGWHVGFGGPGR